KTIDNDIAGTDVTFGFDTAVGVATDAIDRLHTTAEAHERAMVVEVMGRDVGHIALHAGLAGGAATILVPEVPFDIDEVVAVVERRRKLGRYASIIVVAEGALPLEGTMESPDYETDEFGHRRLGGIGELVAAELERRSGVESRVTSLGYVVRGGTPSAGDRVLATRLGVSAANLAAEGGWGAMVGLSGTRIVPVPLDDVAGRIKTCDLELYNEVAAAFFS
ncbi:MAG: 6-phosphofructokinase, partial [Microthrixaceae bacterium]|nr:6-phosphofructokinase [Microthrixaceae bacterium]